MVPPLNYTFWLEPVCILLTNSLHGVPAICTVGCFVAVMAHQCGIAVAVYPRGESKIADAAQMDRSCGMNVESQGSDYVKNNSSNN